MTAPGTGRCRNCRTEILDVRTINGLDLTLDAETLNPLGELRAAVAGRSTYTRYPHSGAVHPRPAYKIRERPAGSRPRQDVHAAHRCRDPRTLDT